jgi:DMSO reductase anchor subunit
MHPANSVIFFTVFSGAGFGLLFLLGFATMADEDASVLFLFVHFGIAFAMAVAGLISSTFHLGHPERAWRALTQWRSSWLSREGVLAILTLLCGGAYAFLWMFFFTPIAPLGWLTAVLALLTVWATGMIYAQIKAVRLWYRVLTPVCYLLFSLAGGMLLFLMLHAAFFGEAGPFLSSVTMVMLLRAWAVKWWWWHSRGDAPISTPGTATGLGAIGKTRLLEAPHTSANYLMKEMGYQIGRKHAEKLRWIAIGLGGVAPIALILLARAFGGDVVWLLLAVILHLAGMLAERWLFFAEAKHAVMAFYR